MVSESWGVHIYVRYLQIDKGCAGVRARFGRAGSPYIC